jgi:DNA-binding NarL/FixJ family response regulator
LHLRAASDYPLSAAPQIDQLPGRIVVLASELSQLQEVIAGIKTLGHHVVHSEPDSTGGENMWANIDVVLIVAEERDTRWIGRTKNIQADDAAPPVVVLGSPSGATWRRQALEAGAFLCASRETPAEELQSIVSAAIRYRALVKENNLLRVECERICMGLLQSYADVALSLKDTTQEVELLQRHLHDIRNQIIRAFV